MMSNQPPSPELWVLEGEIDAPIVLPTSSTGELVKAFSIDFSGGDGDGFVELAALDAARASAPSWWSKDQPVIFGFRCSVVATEPVIAWLRVNDFLEQVLDRLSLLAGAPVTLLSRSTLYCETELIGCKAGARSNFRFQMGGVPANTTAPIRNLHLLPHLQPSDRAKLAMRWFRKALTFDRDEDQFLAFFIALEIVSDDIKAAAVVKPTCRSCGAEVSSFTSHLEGVKAVVKRHKELPSKLFDRLRKTRGKIAHGELSPALKIEVQEYLPLIEQLAVEAIAISLGGDPDSVHVRGPHRIYDGCVLGEITFNAEDNPHIRWGCSVPEAMARYRKEAGVPAEIEVATVATSPISPNVP